MLTGLLFQLPGLVIMTLVGVGAASFLKTPAPWLRGATAGLGAAGVALVAASAFALTRGACRGDGLLLSLSAASAVVTFYTVKIWLFPVLILAGGLVTLAVNAYRRKDMAAKTSGDDEAHVERFGLPRAAGALVVVLWAAVLVATLVAASKVPDFPMGLDLWSAMFRAGSMIFGGEFFSPNVFPPMFFRLVGAEAFFSFLISFFLRLSKKKKKKTGGQVVIPLLYKDVVQRDCDTSVSPPKCVDSPDTWVSSSDFYLGLSVVQGESFSFHSLFSPFFRRSPSLFISSLSFSLTSSFSPSLLLPLPLPSLSKKNETNAIPALPGPLFNFAPYLGAVAGAGSSGKNGSLNAVLGAFLGWLGLNSPGILLFYGLLPWWASFRHFQVYRRMLPGLNAAAVGLVTSAAISLAISLRAASPFPNATVSIGMAVFAVTEVLKVPVPLAVLGGGVLGVVAWAAGMN